MSTLVRFTPKPDVTTEQYDQVMRKLKEGDWLPDGLVSHVAFGSKGNLRVSEVWDSKEQYEKFGKRLMPMLDEAGIGFTGPPELIEVHNIETR